MLKWNYDNVIENKKTLTIWVVKEEARIIDGVQVEVNSPLREYTYFFLSQLK